MVIGDDQLDAAQAAVGQRAQKALPERLGFRGTGGDAEHLTSAIGVDADSDYVADETMRPAWRTFT